MSRPLPPGASLSGTVLALGEPSPYSPIGEGAVLNIDRDGFAILIGLPNITPRELQVARVGRLEMRVLDFGRDGGVALIVIRVLGPDGTAFMSFDCTYHASRVPHDIRGIPSSERNKVHLAHMVVVDERNRVVAIRVFTIPQSVHLALEGIVDAQTRAHPGLLDSESRDRMGNAIYAQHSSAQLLQLPPLAIGFCGSDPTSGDMQ